MDNVLEIEGKAMGSEQVRTHAGTEQRKWDHKKDGYGRFISVAFSAGSKTMGFARVDKKLSGSFLRKFETKKCFPIAHGTITRTREK